MVNAEATKKAWPDMAAAGKRYGCIAEKVRAGFLTGLLALEMIPVHAADSGSVAVDSITISDGNAETIIGKIMGIIIMIARFVGGALLLWGIVMFALSVKNDEPESKQKALMTAFAGVVLFALKEILTAAGIIAVA